MEGARRLVLVHRFEYVSLCDSRPCDCHQLEDVPCTFSTVQLKLMHICSRPFSGFAFSDDCLLLESKRFFTAQNNNPRLMTRRLPRCCICGCRMHVSSLRATGRSRVPGLHRCRTSSHFPFRLTLGTRTASALRGNFCGETNATSGLATCPFEVSDTSATVATVSFLDLVFSLSTRSRPQSLGNLTSKPAAFDGC